MRQKMRNGEDSTFLTGSKKGKGKDSGNPSSLGQKEKEEDQVLLLQQGKAQTERVLEEDFK